MGEMTPSEAQEHVDGLVVAQMIIDFHTEFRDAYPKSVHVALTAVGPLQAMIGLAIRNGHLRTAPKEIMGGGNG